MISYVGKILKIIICAFLLTAIVGLAGWGYSGNADYGLFGMLGYAAAVIASMFMK